VWSLSDDVLYKASRAYKVQPSRHQPSWSEWSSFIYGNCVHEFNRPDVSLQGPDAPKPYYGNYVSSKCNRPDARATPPGRGLVMEAFSAISKRRLKLIFQTLGQAVQTPSGIFIITFYSNIGLGQNWRRWKGNEKSCKLTIWTANRSVRTALWNFWNYFSDKEKVARLDGQVSRPDARTSDVIFDLI